MWVKPVAATIALFGLVLELRGAYLTASMFQPFTFDDFLRHAPRLLRYSLFGHQPDKVLPSSYRTALEYKKDLAALHEASYSFSGLGLLFFGIALQIAAAILMVWAEFRDAH